MEGCLELRLAVGLRDQGQCLSVLVNVKGMGFQDRKARTAVMYGEESSRHTCHCTGYAQQCGEGSVTDVLNYQQGAASVQMAE